MKSSGKESEVEAVAEAEQVVEVELAKAEPVVKERPLIYCGPNLPKGVLLQFTTFKGGGMPKYLDKHVEACPAIKRLCVSVADMAKTIDAINKMGTSESVWAGQVLNYIKGGDK